MVFARLSHMIALLDQTKKLWVSVFFILLLVLGVKVVGDYGISFDEPVSRENGAISLNHAMKHFGITALNNDQEIQKFQTELDTYRDRDYGVAFDLPAFALERLLQINDSRQQYVFKHFLTFLMFFAGTIAIYKLAVRRFSDWKIGLLAATMFVLSPRMFAESFYNGKDIVLMACCAIAMNTAIAFVLKPTIRHAVVHGIATGIAIDVRIVAVIFPALTIAILIIQTFRGGLLRKHTAAVVAVYALVLVCVVVMLWPWLWSNPVGNFATAFRNMSKFRWDNFNYYFGEYVSATQLPWHYSIVWIFITTPIVYSITFLIGMFGVVFDGLKNRIILWKNEEQLQDAIFFGLFFGPLIAIIYFKSVLYDGWRQLYFIYPALLLLSVKGLLIVWRWRIGGITKRALMVTLVSAQLLVVSGWMWIVHPFQNLYFSTIASNKISELFEKDYWGLTNLQGLTYILENDPRSNIRVAAIGATSLKQSVQLLKQEDRRRIQIVSEVIDADFLITNYRFFDGQSGIKNLKELQPVFHIEVNGSNILTIFSINK